ncbi:MAG: hypothetical protein ACRDYA_05525 [Egibacteraceae bacterium]
MAGMHDGDNTTVARLAMIDVTWAYCRFPEREEPQEQIWNQYSRLLCELLDFDPCCRSPASTWIRHCPQLDKVEGIAKQGDVDDPSKDPFFEPYRWFQKQELLQAWLKGWRSGMEAQQTVGLIARGLEQCELSSTRAAMNHQEELLAAQMNLFACRIYLTPERARAKLTPKADPSTPRPHVCIDFRFEEHHGRYWLYAALSAGTHKPSSNAHAPPDLPAPAEGSRDLLELHDWYTGPLRKGFKKRVSKDFPLAEMKILGREYRPPQFWLVGDPGLPATLKTADDLDTDTLNALAKVLLRTPDVCSTGVAASVMERHIPTLRRFVPLSVPDAPGGLPCYVILRSREAAVPEKDAWLLAERLADLEASVAGQLFDVATTLNIYESHLEVYEAVASHADAFWDQVALRLPTARGRRLIRVQKLIELIHQTLLQGIADLDQAAIIVNEAQQRAKQSASELKDQFDRTLTERPVQGVLSIGSSMTSLTETGYLDDAAREADRVVKHAEQVHGSYRMVLEGITRVFDERRVRGTDVLEHVGFALAFLVVVFSFLPEALNALFASWMEPLNNEPNPLSAWVVFFSVLGLIGLAVAGSWVLWRRRKLGTIGSWRFRWRYRLLKGFLTNCATARLSRLHAAGDNAFVQWRELDRKLVRKCANLLDAWANHEDSPPSWHQPPKLKHLARQVEQWALKALLVSERPREFWKFPLPCLTFFYRFYPMMGSELPLGSTGDSEADIVSDTDLRFTIITQCSGSDNDEVMKAIKRWAKHQIEGAGSPWRPARHFAKALNKVGLEVGMTREEFAMMLKRMDDHLPGA